MLRKLFCFRVQNLWWQLIFVVLDSISASWVNFQDHCGREEKRSKWLLALDKNFRCEKVVERGKSSFRYELNNNNKYHKTFQEKDKYCSGAIPILKMIIFCYRWRLFTIFAKRDWLFWPAWAGGVKNHIFGAFTLKVDIKQIFFKSKLFKSSTA